ncbi:GNAT family N-acetyltransferase [Leptolyngbya sp. NK1-12]|uniref:GNAT family N-acetyltransferase n=1 Tax=Leptolyngbya sp. NK1-12 TaxID=2547451 RepID=A0AA96WNG8_9CYAN|nr:GNAT family N-acetyltransferase [Leptolyngbya sp. NK1-12]WNZ25791.1 GNAT family N-acetyltransferase [Leptolyngbya sp. NK1-12]
MQEPLSFRAATQSDAEAIAQVYLSSRKTLVAFAPIAHSDEVVVLWIRNHLIPNHQVIVVEQGHTIIGMMALSVDQETGWIDQLYLHPDFVGQRIGTKLVEYAKNALGSPIRLYTFQENQGAIRFYERQGFKAIQYGDGSGNEENCPDVLYEWR